jgi:hypothetical protein
LSDRKQVRPNFDHNNRHLRAEYYDWVNSFRQLGKPMLPHEPDILAMVTVCGWGRREMLKRAPGQVTKWEIEQVFKKYPHLRVITTTFRNAYKQQSKKEKNDCLSRSISLNEAFDANGTAIHGEDAEKNKE